MQSQSNVNGFTLKFKKRKKGKWEEGLEHKGTGSRPGQCLLGAALTGLWQQGTRQEVMIVVIKQSTQRPQNILFPTGPILTLLHEKYSNCPGID